MPDKMTNHNQAECEPDDLAQAARDASLHAYAPYSGFRVGAAVLADGKIHAGCNVENASYGLSVCAERNAVAAAVVAGCKRIDAVAIYTETEEPTAPCGACRQVIAELGPGAKIYMACRGNRIRVATLEELLPERFELPG